MQTTFPPFLLTLRDKLDFRSRAVETIKHWDAYTVDLSEWKLSFTAATPCLWLHRSTQLNMRPVELAEAIRDVVREQRWQNERVLILLDKPDGELRKHLSTTGTTYIVLDEHQQKSVATALSGSVAMLDLFLAQIDRSQLAPYEIGLPVTGNRFFGRERELKLIRHQALKNYLIFGVRRVGKSSLLREIQRQLELADPPTAEKRRCLYVDCSVIHNQEEFLTEIVGRLNPHALKTLLRRGSESTRAQAQIFDYLADVNGGTITIFLDEVDDWLKYLNSNKSLYDAMRKASIQERPPVRFVMAGFRQAWEVANDQHSQFYNFGERLFLGALEFDDVKNMIEQPLERLRVKIRRRDELIRRIYEETAGLPNLVQYYCRRLLENCDRHGTDTITPDDLNSVYDDRNFQDVIIGGFMSNSIPLERAMVFVLASEEGAHDGRKFTQKEIDALLAKRGLPLKKYVGLEKACHHLETAGILRREGNAYGFSSPIFLRLLKQNYQLDYVFEKARSEVINDSDEG